MTRCIFVGPTLSRDAVSAQLDAICLPPVAQGDVFRAVRRHGPHAIGIVDGFFGGAPAVWHKEILWAMTQGVRVYGSASMGALRAAELHGFGMVGVGRIFEAFRDGLLEDDDEVAITHGPAELGYVSLSEPMVNIRETLACAEAAAVVAGATRRLLEQRAKSLHFADRSWPVILEGAREGGVDPAELARFEGWIRTNAADPKRDDALAMLRSMASAGDGDQQAPAFHFERTQFWAGLASRSTAEFEDQTSGDDAVLDELRLGSPTDLERTRTKALLRFAGDLAPGLESQPDGTDGVMLDALGALRSTLGLHDRVQLENWLALNGIDVAGFADLAESVRRLEALSDIAKPLLPAYLLQELRLSGDYARLAERAQRKQKLLAAQPLPELEDVPPPERLMRRLRFAQDLSPTEDADIAGCLRQTGFVDIEHLDRALHRERLYLKLLGVVGASAAREVQEREG